MRRAGTDAKRLGFTLIEMLAAIVLAAILGTVLLLYTGSQLAGSAESVRMVQKNSRAEKVMENITRDYRDWLEGDPGDLSEFKDLVDSAYPSADFHYVTFRSDDETKSILQITVTVQGRNLVALFTE
jgi:prepilin-type N-terminal cleavage/methylation domain-containing protein